MIINEKVNLFYTDDELKKKTTYETKAKKIREKMQNISAEVYKAEESNSPLLAQIINSANKEMSTLSKSFIKAEDANNALYQAVEKRYIGSFCNKQNEIYTDIINIINNISVNDYTEYQNLLKNDIEVFKKQFKTNEEEKKELNKSVEIGYETFLCYMLKFVDAQINAVEFYKLDTNKIIEILEERAYGVFPKSRPLKNETLETLQKKNNNLQQLQLDEPCTRTKNALFQFSTIRQGNSTNALTKLRATKGKTATIDPITGTATITKGSFSLTIPKYEQLNGLKTSTYQLLDAITVALTISGAKSPTVTIPLSEYMERRGLKNRKEAKNQVKDDIDVLRRASITGEEKRGKNTQSYSFVNIADSGEIKQNGDIVFTYGTTFYHMLLNYPIMPYPNQLQTINNNNNPNSYYLLRKISEHKNMNIGKKNEDTISIKTLLSASPFIPAYDEVMKKDKHINKRIITPFERDMDALNSTLKWHYCHSNGVLLTDEELRNLNYSIFITLLIRTEWLFYPDQTARLERKETTAKSRKKTVKNKKSEINNNI